MSHYHIDTSISLRTALYQADLYCTNLAENKISAADRWSYAPPPRKYTQLRFGASVKIRRKQ